MMDPQLPLAFIVVGSTRAVSWSFFSTGNILQRLFPSFPTLSSPAPPGKRIGSIRIFMCWPASVVGFLI